MVAQLASKAGMATPSPAELQQFERQFRDRQLDYRGNVRERYERRVEREAVLRRLAVRPGERVLDAGCGTGRITQALLEAGATVFAVDFASNRLRFLRDRVPPSAKAKLRLASADVTRLPLAAGSFHAVVCTQVLEHIPTGEDRQGLLNQLHALLQPGGRLVLTVYNFHLPWRRRGQAKEGRHETGVFYHCYTAEELEGELASAGFRHLALAGIINLIPRTYNLWPRLGGLGRACDHALERRALSRRWGHLLLAEARVR